MKGPRLDGAEEATEDQFLDRAVRLIARFILVPLLLVYAVILFAYAVQIALLWQLPEGQVGWMASAFGAAGALTVLLLFPERRTAGPVVRWFTRWWFAITIPPVALLALALQVRVAAYGITEERYALGLVTVWLAVLAVAFARPSVERDVRLLPGVLAALLLFGAFGPWGAEAVSLRSQVAQFTALGRQAGWIDGTHVDAEKIAGLAARPEGASAEIMRARALLIEIANMDGIGRLEGALDNPEALGRLVGSNTTLRAAFAEDLGLAATELPAAPRHLVLAPAEASADIAAYVSLVGPVRFPEDRSARSSGRLEGSTVDVALPGGGTVGIDLAPHLDVSGKAGDPVRLPSFFTATTADGREVGVLVTDARGVWTGSGLDLHTVQLTLMLKAPARP